MMHLISTIMKKPREEENRGFGIINTIYEDIEAVGNLGEGI